KSAHQFVPVARAWTSDARKRGHTLPVVTGDRDINNVAALNAEIAGSVKKIRGRNHALRFRTVVDEHEVAGNPDDGATKRAAGIAFAFALPFSFRGGCCIAALFKLMKNVSERGLFTLFARIVWHGLVLYHPRYRGV